MAKAALETKQFIDVSQLPSKSQTEVHFALEAWEGGNEMERIAEEIKKEEAKIITQVLKQEEIGGLIARGKRLALSTSSQSTLSKERLLEKGVSPDIIAYATVHTESAPFLKISVLNSEKGRGN